MSTASTPRKTGARKTGPRKPRTGTGATGSGTGTTTTTATASAGTSSGSKGTAKGPVRTSRTPAASARTAPKPAAAGIAPDAADETRPARGTGAGKASSAPIPVDAPAPAAALTAKASEAAATMQAAAAETIRQAEAALSDVKIELEEAVASQRAEAENALKAGQDTLAWNLEQGVMMGKEQMESAASRLFTTLDDAAARTREGVDALFSAGQAWSEGVEAIAKSLFATQQTMMENGMEAMKAMLGARTLHDVVDLQSSYTRQAFDGVVAESIKLSEMAMKVANDTTAPINTQVTRAMEGSVAGS